MQLIEYTPGNCTISKTTRKPLLTLTKAGCFTINKEARELIGLDDAKPQVKFLQDKDEPANWYICAASSDGFELKTSGAPYSDGTHRLKFNSRTLRDFIFESCGEPEAGVSIPVSDEGMEVQDTGMAYPLITAKIKAG